MTEEVLLSADVRSQLQNLIDMLLTANIPFGVDSYEGKKIISHKDCDEMSLIIYYFNSMDNLDKIEAECIN